MIGNLNIDVQVPQLVGGADFNADDNIAPLTLVESPSGARRCVGFERVSLKRGRKVCEVSRKGPELASTGESRRIDARKKTPKVIVWVRLVAEG